MPSRPSSLRTSTASHGGPRTTRPYPSPRWSWPSPSWSGTSPTWLRLRKVLDQPISEVVGALTVFGLEDVHGLARGFKDDEALSIYDVVVALTQRWTLPLLRLRLQSATAYASWRGTAAQEGWPPDQSESAYATRRGTPWSRGPRPPDWPTQSESAYATRQGTPWSRGPRPPEQWARHPLRGLRLVDQGRDQAQ